MRHISMSSGDLRPNPSGGAGRFARTLAIPVAVLLAAGGCTAALATWGEVPVSEVRLVLEEPESESTGAPGPAEPSSAEPEPSPEPEPTPERSSGLEGAAEDTAAGSASITSFDGSSTSVGPFRVVVEVAYTDPTITDGMGSHAAAPSGMTYYIYRLNVTNQGSSPAIFDSHGTRGFSPDGTSYANDIEAEVTVAWDYFWGEINPGTTVTTHLMFLLPEGTELTHLRVSGQSELHPS